MTDYAPPGWTKAQLNAAIATGAASPNGMRPGNRLAVIGDSTTRGVYNGDSEPGIMYGGTLNTAYIAGSSWITNAAAVSGGKIYRALNAGVIGDTIALMDARVETDVIAHTPRPSACVVYSGYNDAYGNVTLADFMVSYLSIVHKLRAAGIVPIMATPLPTANNAVLAGLLAQYALGIRKAAMDGGYLLLDFQEWAMDPLTGGLNANVETDSSDGVHPGRLGQRWLGQKVADTLGPLMPLHASPLQISPLDISNSLPNGLFVGTPDASGLAPNVFGYGTAPAQITYDIVTDAQVPGSMQRITHAGTATQSQIAQQIGAADHDGGDWFEFSGIITCAGIIANVQIEFNSAPYAQRAIRFDIDTTRGYFAARVQAPAGSAGKPIYMIFNSGPGTGTASIGQMTARNLTRLGLV